jgi:hypothetical protein
MKSEYETIFYYVILIVFSCFYFCLTNPYNYLHEVGGRTIRSYTFMVIFLH